MASLEYLREMMAADLAIMDDTSKPSEVRRAARSRFWHCEKRAGAMERAGLSDDEPGHILTGYSEIGITDTKKTKKLMTATPAQTRRDLIDKQTDAHFRAKETF